MTETVFRNARIVLPDAIVEGDLVVRDGLVAEVSPAGTGTVALDVEGDWLVPGLVELHTDHLEGHYAPRPKVRWNPVAAVQAHDAQIASSGITTVFDALRVGMDEDTDLGSDDMARLADAIVEAQAAGRLRADHFIHLRCEVCAPDVIESFGKLEANRRVRLASLMDHTPGQRQFTSMETYRLYYQGKTGMTDAEFEAFVAKRQARAGALSGANRRVISARCQERGIIVASHDDASTSHVDEAIENGVHVAEFPTTFEAAEASRAAGMKILMGAPNVVRGGSHSGNVSARALAERGLLDVLSSGYLPFSLPHAPFLMPERGAGMT
ncbi:MAG TPA: alpha-D-ribose 1-methylphosphonate 5-triphosphate diphosphatase, partial [Bauldia sp.]|nr:alpha-D-ribose 1-methylphosphonate 5-triphosphate diphosphatase [Bauldia sp.]